MFWVCLIYDKSNIRAEVFCAIVFIMWGRSMTGFSKAVWQRAFYGIMALYGCVVLFSFSQYGVTTDEPLHVLYGEHIGLWYGSLFRDHTVFLASNLWLYGGLFDMAIYVLKQIVPMDVYDLRHLVCAGLGMTGVLAAYKIGSRFGGSRAGFLAALFLLLTPRYFGHAFNNTKDIPFAVGYVWSVYYIIRWIGCFPKVPRALLWKLGVVIGMTFGIRSSATLLVCYLGLFAGLRAVQIWRWEPGNLPLDWRRQGASLLCLGGIVYLTVFPFFPYLHLHPITGLMDSLSAFSKFPEIHYNFFEGKYIPSNALPWYYIPKWLFLTIPEFGMLGLVMGIAVLVAARRSILLSSPNVLQVGLLIFAAVFPVVFGMVSHTPLLNGMRHLTFVVPPLMIVSALGVHELVGLLQKGWARWATGLAIGAALLVVGFDMVTMHPNQVVYFNRIYGGGLAQASTQFDTDYWNHTYKQALRWVEENAPDKEENQKPVIGSLYKNVGLMVDGSKFDFATTRLHHADYYLGNAYFDAQRAVPGDILHTIDVQGVPLCYVIRPDVSKISEPFFDQSPLAYDVLGDALRAEGDADLALVAYGLALERLASGFKRVGIDSSGVLHKMGNVMLGMDRVDDALATFDRIPDRETFEGSVANNVGIYYIGKEEYARAVPWLKQAVVSDPDFYVASVSLGNLYLQLNERAQAIQVFRESAIRHRGMPDRQFEIGRLLYELEQFEDARLCFQSRVELRYRDFRGLYYLGLSQARLGNYMDARSIFERAIASEPGAVDPYQSLGAVCMNLEDYDAAAKAYAQVVLMHPEKAEAYVLLGTAYLNLGNYEDARAAFAQALVLNPADAGALNHLNQIRSLPGDLP
jgi:tetratricopeptide (TPR) repeat protein